MSIIDKIFCFASRYALIALAAFIGFAGSSAKAQVAPQLLPYSVKVIAGGGKTATFTPNLGGGCTVSGYTPTDIYGDGCLATEIQLTGPRTAVADVNGNVFFTDYTNGLIRRVDAITGVVSLIAGGVSASASPKMGVDCVAGNSATTATDNKGDGCLGTQVFLIEPIGLTFSPAGDLYFSEFSANVSGETAFGADVRKIAATGGLISTTGKISMVDGALSGYSPFGYEANPSTCTASSTSTCIVAATQSYLDSPYGIAFDPAGNVYISEEGKQAVLVVNTNTTGYTTVTGIQIPAGTVAKIVGTPTSGGPYCPNGSSGTNGCNSGAFTNFSSANSSKIDDPYAVALDPSGNVYFVNEFNYDIAEVSATGSSTSWASAPGIINNFAGVQSTGGTSGSSTTARAAANTLPFGSTHGVAIDSLGNAYITDSNAYNTTGTKTAVGVVWRVDSADNIMYLVAGGATTVCSTSIVPGVTTIDAYGDGCAATSAIFGTHNGTTGIFGISVDQYSDLFVGDTLIGLVREVASGTQFGPIGANQPTQYIDIHFGAGDSPEATGAYTLALTGAGNFSLGTATCTTNSDTTKDCVLPIKATPLALGPFSGTLQVTSTLGGMASFALSGDYVASPLTRTIVTASQTANCANTLAYSTSTPVVLTATIFTSGANPPSGTVTFYANGTQIGSPATVNSNAATLTYTFSTAGTYAVTAVYSGDSYYKTSTSATNSIASSAPSFSGTAVSSQQNSVTAGQTALYSFTLQQNVYAGTLTFSCSGLPANSSCVFHPSTITAIGCQVSSTVAMSILTQSSSQSIAQASLGGGGRSWRPMLSILPGLGLALLIGLRRRKVSLRYSRVWMALVLLLASVGIASCNSNVAAIPATPAGSYIVTVTITGSSGASSTFTVPLTVH